MKKKNILTKVLITVVCVYGVAGTIFFGGNALKQKEVIIEKEKTIQEQQSTISELGKETDKQRSYIDTQHDEIYNLQSEVDSARRRIEETRGRIESLRSRVLTVKVTGYCPCEICCGEWAIKNPGITASGTRAKIGTIAAPTSIPFGTKMKIEGYGDQVFTVEDTGSAVKERNGVYVIDMWMPTHEQAYAIGNSIVKAVILE